MATNRGEEIQHTRITIGAGGEAGALAYDATLCEFVVYFKREARREGSREGDGPEGSDAAEILLEEVVGIQVLGRTEGGGEACRVELHSYPYVDRAKRDKRHFLLTTVDFSSCKTVAENVEAALEWKRAVLAECDNAVRKTFAFENDEEKGKALHVHSSNHDLESTTGSLC